MTGKTERYYAHETAEEQDYGWDYLDMDDAGGGPTSDREQQGGRY